MFWRLGVALRLAQTSLPPAAEAARQMGLEIAALEAELTTDQRAGAERHISAWIREF